MFAYCQGNPVNFQDSAGTRMVPADPLRGGPLPDRDYPRKKTGKTKKKNTDVLDYVFNDDEQKVLEAKHFTMYKGVPVIKLPIGTDAFSLGIMILGNDVGKRSDAIETVKHEYGHAVHYRLVGAYSYVANVFVPSVAGYWLGGENYDANYYSHVYEYTADILGGVNRSNYSYATATKDWWGAYLFYTILYP